MNKIRALSKQNKIILLLISMVFVGFLFREVMTAPVSIGLIIRKIIIMLVVYLFAVLHCFVAPSKIYDVIFRKRWWFGLAIFAFLVINKYNFSSVSTFDGYVQSGEGSEYVTPIFGHARGIRSDEWMVNLPRAMTGEYTDYAEYNDIVCGMETTNIAASGLYLNYSALAKPADWGYYLFGTEYGLAWHWAFKMVFGFLFLFELFLILTKENRLLAVFGAALTWFSAYNLWWSTVTWMWAGSASIVLFVYFIKEKCTWKRILYGIGIAIFGSAFTVDLYPAWLVPAGYVFLMLLIWAFISLRQEWKQFKWIDWLISFACICFMGSIICVYLMNYSEYMQAITNTVYPGTRVSYGGYSLYKMLGYFSSVLAPYLNYANPCENSCFFIVYPLGYILGIIVLIKKKGKSLLLWLLAVPTVLLTAYCTAELPPILVKVTLLTYSVPTRAIDILGFLLAIILVVALSEIEKQKGLNIFVVLPIVAISTSMAISYSVNMEIGMKRKGLIIALALFVMVIEILVISQYREKISKGVLILATAFLIFTGISVHPLNYGIDAITSKPVAKEIQEIVAQDNKAKWIATDSMVTGNFLIACGASTYNSANYIPNMELWKILDPEGIYDEVYNRYAHVIIYLVEDETRMQLLGMDCMVLYLSYDDLDKIGVDYIYSQQPLNGTKSCQLELLYEEAGSYIYSR